MASTIEFLKQVRTESKKITWPSRQETIVSTISVFVMVFLAAVFLYLSDQVMAWAVQSIMNIGL